MKDTKVRPLCQPFRLGRVHLRPGPRGTGAALVPVLSPVEGVWAAIGLLRVDARRFPSTGAGRRRLISRAIRAARRALSGEG